MIDATQYNEVLKDLKHSSILCSDENPINAKPVFSSEKPKCQRCAILKAIADPSFKLEVTRFVNYDITLI